VLASEPDVTLDYLGLADPESLEPVGRGGAWAPVVIDRRPAWEARGCSTTCFSATRATARACAPPAKRSCVPGRSRAGLTGVPPHLAADLPPWRAVVAALDEHGAFRSRVSAYLHPLAGRATLWHVLRALLDAPQPPREIVVLHRPRRRRTWSSRARRRCATCPWSRAASRGRSEPT
jgi:hypothetical protein